MAHACVQQRCACRVRACTRGGGSARALGALRCAHTGCTTLAGASEGDAGSKRCWGCSVVRYCGRECQRADWLAHHRRVCGPSWRARRPRRSTHSFALFLLSSRVQLCPPAFPPCPPARLCACLPTLLPRGLRVSVTGGDACGARARAGGRSRAEGTSVEGGSRAGGLVCGMVARRAVCAPVCVCGGAGGGAGRQKRGAGEGGQAMLRVLVHCQLGGWGARGALAPRQRDAAKKPTGPTPLRRVREAGGGGGGRDRKTPCVGGGGGGGEGMHACMHARGRPAPPPSADLRGREAAPRRRVDIVGRDALLCCARVCVGWGRGGEGG